MNLYQPACVVAHMRKLIYKLITNIAGPPETHYIKSLAHL